MTNELNARRLNGKRAVVTAAAQGIGRAVALRFLDEGAEVHASDINEQGLSDFGAANIAQLDATDEERVARYFEQFDRIDSLVHAVGFVHHGTIEDCTLSDWRKTIMIGLDSAYLVLRHALPKMKEHGGSITCIASVASSTKGFPKRAAYGAAKGGVIGLTKAVAADYLQNNIRCNSVCPGTVASPSLEQRMDDLAESLGGKEAARKYFIDRQPSGRFGTPEEIAAVCAFLASSDGSFVTGQALNVDGGITI